MAACRHPLQAPFPAPAHFLRRSHGAQPQPDHATPSIGGGVSNYFDGGLNGKFGLGLDDRRAGLTSWAATLGLGYEF
jgi:hypothetical protein